MRSRHDGQIPHQGVISLGTALFLAFGLILLALCGGVFAVSLQSSSRMVEQVSAPVIAHAREQTYGKLKQLFEPIVAHLAVDRNRIRSGVIDPHNPDALRALFLPSLQQLPQCGSMMVADAQGSQWLLMKYDELVVNSPLLESRREQLP